MGQAGNALSQGMQHFSQAPGRAAAGFGKNLVSGAFGAGGKGTIGGMAGRGLNYAATAQGMYSLMGGGRQPQQQMQPMQG
jgi:hypothetical protein